MSTTTQPSEILTVSSSDALAGAVREVISKGGGTVQLTADGGPYYINLSGVGQADTPVTITAADPANPPVVVDVSINSSHNITLDGLRFEAIPTGHNQNIRIYGSTGIAVSNNVMQGKADGHYTGEDGSATRGSDLLFIRESQDVSVIGNTIAGYFHGIGVLDSSGLLIHANDISEIQGDGFRGGGIQDSVLSGNYMHDFYGTPQSVNHQDMIQLWGSFAKSANSNITITGNVLSAGAGVATQSLFILNESFGNDGHPSSGYFTNFTITDNVIHNGARNGIYLSSIKGLVLQNNTVLQDKDAYAWSTTTVSGNDTPWILLRNTLDQTVTGNIMPKLYTDGEIAVFHDNYTATFGGETAQSHPSNMLVNYTALAHDPRDYLMQGDSRLGGIAGAMPDLSVLAEENGLIPIIQAEAWHDHTQAVTLTALAMGLDAGLLALADDQVLWRFDDGTERRGVEVTHVHDGAGIRSVELILSNALGETSSVTRQYMVQDPELVAFDFEGDVTDQSGRGTPARLIGGTTTPAFVNGPDGQAFHLTGNNRVEFAARTDYFFGLNRFQIDLDLRAVDPGKSGALLERFQSFSLSVVENGSLKFDLRTDEGRSIITTATAVLADRAWHAISVRYDGSAELLQILSDGQVMAQGRVGGVTTQTSYWPVFVGPNFGAAPNVLVDNLVISQPPSAAARNRLEEVQDPDLGHLDRDEMLFYFDFDGQLTDATAYATQAYIRGSSVDALTEEGRDGGGFALQDQRMLEIDRADKHVSGLDTFTLGLSLQKAEADGTGVLMSVFQDLRLAVNDGGGVDFWMDTSDGRVRINTGDGFLDDTAWHDLELRFDGAGGSVEIWIDDDLAGSAAAAGTATPIRYYGLALGAPWEQGLTATIDDFFMKIPDDDGSLLG